MLAPFTLNSDSYPAISTRKRPDMRLYTDCAWILEKATFLNGESISEYEAIIKCHLKSYLKQGDVYSFLLSLQSTVAWARALRDSYNLSNNHTVMQNSYTTFLSDCMALFMEMVDANTNWYSKKSNLLWSNQTMTAIAVRKTLEQKDSTYSFWE
jgi:hypothetical protein